jgi:hypothetical protein
MTMSHSWFRVFSLMAALLLPVAAIAADDDKNSQAGKNAAGNRGDEANDRSNAQWQDDATRGQERAEEVRGEKGKGKGKMM